MNLDGSSSWCTIYNLKNLSGHQLRILNAVDASKKFCSDFLFEKTELRIDQPTSDGGTTSTGNIARQCLAIRMSLISTFRQNLEMIFP